MDFKLNMGELEEVLTSLHKMKASLETLDSVLVNVQDAVGKQKGKLADALSIEFSAHRDEALYVPGKLCIGPQID
ncbi:hypothetical protein HCJ57_03690 [Listeria booriae]|uniref:hypothetical protein n=1 Tax=Listeria booriae TaxID=1552123 RepID=UPI0016284A86|nr:hypothetical protein [Listeria booriae]MBC2055588.1 hypothetical protein [Listeria booriae]